MKKAGKSVKIIVALIIMILVFIITLALLIKFNIIKISKTNYDNSFYSDNIKKEELCKGIWYYYDEGLSAYILLDETNTERKKVYDEQELEYYKESPERLFYSEDPFSHLGDDSGYIIEDTIEE